MPSLASINIVFRADLKQFSSQLQNAQRDLDKAGKKLQSTGKSLSAAITLPFVALAGVSLVNFDEQAKAIAQVEAGLVSTGSAAGYTSEQLQKMASDLQSNTLFGDDEILKDATAQLLTFTNIAGIQFERTQQAALNLATRLDGDLKGASIQLGKALNDPVANLSALSRSGIQFSTDQKKMIDALVATNRLADAQTIILDELEKQYGGSAEAAAKAGTGPLKQLGIILGDVTEDFGAIIFEGIQPFIEKIKGIAKYFTELSPATKKWIVILGGIAAAIGPLLALAGTILPAIGTGLALLSGPIGLIIAGLTAIGIVIYKNWSPIKKTLIDIANYFIDLYNESTAFRVGVQVVIKVFKDLFEVGKFIFETLKNIIGGFIENFVNGFKTVGKIIKAVFTGNLASIPDILKEAADKGTDTFKGFTKELGADWKKLTDGIADNTRYAIDNITTKQKIKFLEANVDASGIESAVSKAVVGGSQTVTGGTSAGSAKLKEIDNDLELFDINKQKESLASVDALLNNTLQNFANAVDDAKIDIFSSTVDSSQDSLETSKLAFDDYVSNFSNNAEKLKELGLAIPETFTNALGETNADVLNAAAENFTAYVDNIESENERLAEIGTAIADSVASGLGSAIEAFGEFIGKIATGNATIGDLFKGLLGVVADFIGQLGKALVAAGIAGLAFKKLFANPIAAIAAGTALIVLSTIVKNLLTDGPKSAGAFAEGGIVGGSSFYGDKILARVNSGELILNQNQQRKLYNSLGGSSSSVTVSGVLRGEGRELVAVIDKTNVQLSRTR